MIYLEMTSVYHLVGEWRYRTVDGTVLKTNLLLVSRQFGEEYLDLFLKLKTFRLRACSDSVTHPPMHFNYRHHPQAPLHILRHVEMTINVGEWRFGRSVVTQKQKRKAETVASSLSHTLGKMKCLQSIKVKIVVGDRRLEKGFRNVFEGEGFGSICPAWSELKGRKELKITMM